MGVAYSAELMDLISISNKYNRSNISIATMKQDFVLTKSSVNGFFGNLKQVNIALLLYFE